MPTPPRMPVSTYLRAGLLGLVVLTQLAVWTLRPDDEALMEVLVLIWLASAPLLVWFTLEPEPEPEPASSRFTRWVFGSGGASGVVYFLVFFGLQFGLYVLYLGVVSRGRVWLADDDPVQLLIGMTYACLYVLLPVGLWLPLLRSWPARLGAALTCMASYPLWMAAFPAGPRVPDHLTELGDPGRMIRTILSDGRPIHYAQDDLAVLVGLALLGVALNVPRVVRSWRATRPLPPAVF